MSVPLYAGAAPYELVAQYSTIPDKNALESTVDLYGFVARDAVDAAYKDVALRFKTDELSKLQLSRIENVDVYARNCLDYKCANGFGAGQHEPDTANLADHSSKEKTVNLSPVTSFSAPISLSPVAQFWGANGIPVEVQVIARFSKDFLCTEELGLRESKGKKIEFKSVKGFKTTDLVIKAKDLPDPKGATTDAYVEANLLERGLFNSKGEPIVYSFCDTLHSRINFKELSKTLDTPGADARGIYKQRLVDFIVNHLNGDQSLGSAYGAKRQADDRISVYASFIHQFWLIRSWTPVTFVELPEEQVWHKTVDKSATVSIRGASRTEELCGGHGPDCGDLFNALKVKAHFKSDSKDSTEDEKGSLGAGSIEVPLSLDKHLAEWVTIQLYLPVGDSKILVAESSPACVENLGWVTTFPVITDVVTALNADAKKLSDISVQSSIPLSWAVNLSTREAAHAAITFPWMVGFNSRAHPRAADVFKVFPHVSLIMPLSSDTSGESAHAALGVGIALVNAFTFSWGVTLKDDPQQFLLVGVSIPDLVKVGKAFGPTQPKSDGK